MPTILTPPQRRFLRILLALALFVLANSAYLFLSDHGENLTVFYQLMLLGHLVGGALLLVLATAFLIWHLRRVRNLMRLGAVSSGAGLTLAAYLLFATGIFIIYEAKTRDHFWIFRAHQVLALLAPLLYGVHRWVSHFPPRRRSAARGGLVFAALLVAMLLIHAATAPPPESEPVAEAPRADPFIPFAPANFPDESSPFFPASTTTSSGDFLEARIIRRDERGDLEAIRADVEKYGFAVNTALGAETCRRCHPDTVAQWEASAHRFGSFNNPFYRFAVETLRDTVGKKPSQWCAGCHDPAIMLAGNMEKEIDPNTPESQAGLTCMACHAIDKLHGIEGNGNYNIADETPSPYIFDSATSGFGRFLADQAIKSKPAVHKRQLLKPFHGKSEFCMTCHKVSIDIPVNNYRWLRGQNEYDNWHDSGVSRNAARTFYLPEKARACQDCHMPYEDAPLGDVAAEDGKVRSHRFLAVNTALPYIRGDFDTIHRIEKFLQDEKLRVDVFALQFRDGTMSRALVSTKPYLVPGEEVVFEVVVRNKGVGHTFPGGTNDSNESWIDFEVRDEQDRLVFRSGALEKDGSVSKTSHFYRVVMVRHDGTEADKRDAQTFHAPAFTRVIGPGTADVARFAVTIPDGLAGQRLKVRARLQWRKFNRRYTEHVFAHPGIRVPDLPHLEGKAVPELPITTIAQDAITLDVREKRGALAKTDDPRLWEVFNDHGIASFLQGAFDVAEQSWLEVVRLQPRRVDGYLNLARRWIASATPEKAEAWLQKAREIDPGNIQWPYFWGRYNERIENYEEAERAYLDVTNYFPDDRDTWRRIGAVRYKLHRYEESLKAYLKVLAIDPEDLESHKRRLDIYNQLGKKAEAAEAEKAYLKYKRDEEAEQVARRFLLERKEINLDAQRRHVHR
jgi:Tfp pilus assembly protein PilF